MQIEGLHPRGGGGGGGATLKPKRGSVFKNVLSTFNFVFVTVKNNSFRMYIKKHMFCNVSIFSRDKIR
jgi:hypothetical protein